MISKYQACGAIGFTLAALLGSQVIGDRLGSAMSRSDADTVRVRRQQIAGSDRFGERLNSDGAMLGVNLRRTRVYDSQGLQESKSLLWKTPKLFTIDPREKAFSILDVIGPQIRNRPLLIFHAAVTIITANKEAYLIKQVDGGIMMFVIDLQTGEAKKRFKFLGRNFSGPVVAGDLLFVGESTGSFYAFDHRDWKTKWEIDKKGYDTYGSAPVVADGVIYFGDAKSQYEPSGPYFGSSRTIKGNVNAFDAVTGAQKWMFPINGYPTLIAVADEVIYFGDDDRHLFAVSAKDGKAIWKFKASEDISTPAIMDGRAFFSDRGGDLYAVDLKNGQAIWKAAKKSKVATALVAYNKLIYYGGRENSLYAVDALTGEEKWIYRTTKPCPAPVAANGAIYVACQDNTLLMIDAERGQERWKYQTPRRPISHPVVGNGVIYYQDEEGVMYALGSS
jgi:outer membrane protein assembly factor BamB